MEQNKDTKRNIEVTFDVRNDERKKEGKGEGIKEVR